MFFLYTKLRNFGIQSLGVLVFWGVSRGVILLKDECEKNKSTKNSESFPFSMNLLRISLMFFGQGQHLAFGQTHRNGERYPERRSTALGAGGLDGDG